MERGSISSLAPVGAPAQNYDLLPYVAVGPLLQLA